jgi:flavin reductase (DIM6/NTAB) family NADH-FMN oxidoreductase RutF
LHSLILHYQAPRVESLTQQQIRGKMNFRDIMSLVPTSVSVITCREESLIYGCTISSLVSVDVQEENPAIVFVLKKQSLVGKKIKAHNYFTINVLSASQDERAQRYSADRLPENISDHGWILEGDFAEIPKCRITMNCNLLTIYDNHAADIFVGQVVKYSGDQSQASLIYDARRYGRFQSN